MAESPNRFIVDNLFTRNRLHLIFGPPSSGRSTLLHQTMWDWANGRDVFGHKSYPAPFVLIDAVRPLEEIRAQFADLSLPIADITHVSLIESIMSHEERTVDMVFSKAKNALPTCKVIFLDGLQALFHGNVIHYREVLNFAIDLAKGCHTRQITVIATLNTSKSLEGSDTPILQRVMGSTAWLETAGCKIHIGPEQGQELEAERTVTCFIPRRKPLQLKYGFTEGGALELRGDASQHPEMDLWLTQVAAGSDMETKEILDAGEVRDLSNRTIARWLKQQLELGTLVRVDKGVYRKPVVS